jgi:hypothetical protein
MLENEEMARMKVNEALRNGMHSQRNQRGLPRRRFPITPAKLSLLFAALWVVRQILF